MAAFADSGDPEIGTTCDTVRGVKYSRCDKLVQTLNDPKQSHLQYEAREEHGMFMDVGEFTDYKHEALLDTFRDVAASIKRQ